MCNNRSQLEQSQDTISECSKHISVYTAFSQISEVRKKENKIVYNENKGSITEPSFLRGCSLVIIFLGGFLKD